MTRNASGPYSSLWVASARAQQISSRFLYLVLVCISRRNAPFEVVYNVKQNGFPP
ncbi:rCG59284, partial [Rattus norvegicus]